MKEAAGEANMTVITIVLIGVVAAAGAILIPRIMGSLDKKSCCTESGGTWYRNACYNTTQCSMQANGRVNSCSGSSFTPNCN